MSKIVKNINEEFNFSISAFVNGNLTISSFIEDIDGVTSDRYFIKKFQYSFDGLVYSAWFDLNEENIIQISGYSDNILFMNFKYIRKGSDSSGDLTFNSLKLLGDIVLQINSYDTTSNSIFSEILENDFYTKSIRSNLLRKIFNSGILPKYIERNGESDDKDFISFWGAICGFFALISTFAEDFDNIPFESKKLRKYLEQNNIALHKDSTLLDLQFISENLLNQLRYRGTIIPTKAKNFKSGDNEKNMQVIGEWLRLISYDEADEFVIDFERKKDNGYFLNQSSVIYPGTFRDNQQVNKYKDFHYDYSENFPKKLEDINRAVKISKDVDYIVEFKITKPEGLFDLKLGVVPYNSNGYFTPASFKNCVTEQHTVFFLNGIARTLASAGTFVIKCIIFNNDYDFSENNELNINMGYNLKQENSISNSIIPFIEKSDLISLDEISIRPLVKGWTMKRQKNPQFLQSLKFINNYRKNNSNDKDEFAIDYFIEKYLMPYHYKLNSIALKYKKPEIIVEIPETETPTEIGRIFDDTYDITYN